MNNEIRNELLNIKNLFYSIDYTEENKQDLKMQFDFIIERFEIDLKNKKQNAEREIEQCNDNLEIVKSIREMIKRG